MRHNRSKSTKAQTAKPSRDSRTAGQGQVGEVRIIAGKWRGRKIPVADSHGLRPTTDRTKETLFNWLIPYLNVETRCLDLFAGSGSLTFEALSRGAKSVTTIEKQSGIVKKLKDVSATLGVEDKSLSIINDDFESFLSSCQSTFDLVFLDPPFAMGLLPKALDGLVKNQLLAPEAIIYVEYETSLNLIASSEFEEIKTKQTKQVVSKLLRFRG
ncbi:MAG: 16S rRNA (guanine(966)-N(2))-methyltransferase RsmD [Alteromonadaceae bacterium]|nr:16S rRNA (guanine(966)-N(2))-methyltransferase RsmD [Alteromonadaceae bacterium]